jgi:hypothetical protein
MSTHPRTPQEKKRLSYTKDRRNVFGENSKASRKAVPLRKKLRSRATRHLENTQLSVEARALPSDEVVGKSKKAAATHPVWRKTPDRPLGEVLVRKRSRGSTAPAVEAPNKALERTVIDKLPTERASRAASSVLTRQRAAAQRQR